jgi:uncharacterized protein
VLSIPAEAARRFLVRRQLLAPPRSVEGGPDAVMEVVRHLGSVQFDPLAVAGRNHDLVLHARVHGYRRGWTDELLYDRRELFEAHNKGLSLLPIDELPWYRVSWKQTVNAQGILAEHADVVKRVLKRIRAEGPLSSLDFERGPKIDWWLGPTSVVRLVLESLSATGVLGLARRKGNRRYYDLVERLYPAKLMRRKVPRDEQLRHKMLSRFRAHGLAGASGAGDMWGGLGYARADPRSTGPSRNEMREQLIAEGALVPVTVEGLRGKRFVLREEIDQLEATGPVPPAVSFIAPLDPLVWDRSLLEPLFDFAWAWEVYLPEPKRRWGYYVLPILFGDRLVGKFEPRIDGGKKRMRVLGVWWEEWFDPRRAGGFVDAMREAVKAYLRFAGAEGIEWAPHLSREKRLFGKRP